MRIRQLLMLTLVILLTLSSFAIAEKVDLGAKGEDVSVIVEQSDDYKTVLRFEVGAFYRDVIDLNGEKFYSLSCGDEPVLLIEGEPALPHICRSIIIPDDAKMEVRVISEEFVDIPDMPVIPSKGNLKRTVNPDDIAYTFGDVYSKHEWYPEASAVLREPFIFRDFRGTVVEINPFRYNPAEKTLRVYTSITVEVVNVGPGEINVLYRKSDIKNRIPEFEQMYQRRFLNYYEKTEKYPAVGEIGDMLIITYDSFHDAMLPLVEWKLQKGIKTTIANISAIGNNSTNIKNFINSVYNIDSALAWVLLVGDAAQIAPGNATGDYSDTYYSKIIGTDDWPEVIVGRFSAENVSQVETQVIRSINYEKTPYGSDWFHKATGIGSAEGPGGHYGEYDCVHEGNIRNDLLAYNYTLVDQICDPGATASQVSTALNNGRSFVNYTGHGSTTAWSTTGFSNTNVNALTNDNMLPLIFSVACYNGSFVGSTCFGEAWQRATNGSNPTGAIASYMSVISQSWAPPMYAQDEATDLLVAESKLTIGGLCYNGSLGMIEAVGATGIEEFNAWTIFGDPSVMLRTDDPVTLTVNHPGAHIFTQPDLQVEVVGVEGALCALYNNGILYGSGYTGSDGIAPIEFFQELPVGEVLTLTVTSYNTMPYFGTITIIAPEGPFVIYDEHAVNDALGNNDGFVDCGESITLDMQLQNV
ncbi:MAG: C25 family cysteine peptidase, partial [Candidatus Zixiibacteriota bacterium]